MLYFGELYKKLQTIDEPQKRFRLLDENMNGSLSKFLRMYLDGVEFVDVLKDRPVLFEDSPYSRTISNFYREFNKFLYFRKEVGQNMPPEKLIDMMDRSMLQMHREESQLLVDWIRGDLVWPQTKEEISQYLSGVVL